MQDLTEATNAQRLALLATNDLIRRLKFSNLIMICAVMAGIALSVLSLFTVHYVSQTNQAVQDSQRKIQEIQDRTSNQVLCPLYSLLIKFEPRVTTNPAISEADRNSQKDLYVVIHQGYDQLGCRG